MNATKPAASTAPTKGALVAGGTTAAIVPQDYDTAYRMAALVVSAGMAPKSINTPEKACVAIMHGLEVGLTPMAALQSIAVINGMPTIFGDGLLALVRASGLLEDIQEELQCDDDGTPAVATCKVKRRGEASWKTQVVTRPQCQKAGWWRKEGPWTATPGRMMQSRARGWVLRDAFADVLRGLHNAEEVQDGLVDVTGAGSATVAPPNKGDYVEGGAKAGTGDKPAATGDAGKANSEKPKADAEKPPGDQPQSNSEKVTDVVDQNQTGDQPEKLTFEAYTKTSDFVEFSDHFLRNTSADGAKQWKAHYTPALEFMKSHKKPAMVDAYKGLMELFNERVPEADRVELPA